MSTSSDKLLSDFIDAWNAGDRPEADAYLARCESQEREGLADSISTFLIFAPTPEYDQQTLEDLRADPIVVAARAAARGRSGLIPELLQRVRRRLGLSTDDVAQKLVVELGLAEQARPKTVDYLDRWERGELSSARVSQRVLDGLARALRLGQQELRDAADFGGARAAPVFRATTSEPALGDDLESLADALEAPVNDQLDDIDALFTGGR